MQSELCTDFLISCTKITKMIGLYKHSNYRDRKSQIQDTV